MPELQALASSLLCIGVPGGVDEDSASARETWETLRRLSPGGVVLFARNISSLEAARGLVARLVDMLGGDEPPSICIDQEGGRVARIDLETPMPSAMALGAAGDAALAARTGSAIDRCERQLRARSRSRSRAEQQHHRHARVR